MILADTSVWIDHFRAPNTEMQGLLLAKQIVMHPAVIGELACGNLPRRAEMLGFLSQLPSCSTATDREALELIERRRLWGRGVGWVDVHLLASALLSTCRLWSLDRQLQEAARLIGIDYRPR